MTKLIILPDYINVIKSFEMTLDSKCKKKIKTKRKHRYRNTKNQNTERRKPSFAKRIGRKCRLISTRTEQNNDRTQVMYEKQFRSSFKNTQHCTAAFIAKQLCAS